MCNLLVKCLYKPLCYLDQPTNSKFTRLQAPIGIVNPLGALVKFILNLLIFLPKISHNCFCFWMQLELSLFHWFLGLLFLIIFLAMPLSIVALRNRKAFRCFQTRYRRSASLD